MEFNEKLQNLRKSKGLTQEELADKLYVSRTAISKWESGRGFPNIDSLKEISKFFCISLDELLSSEEVLNIAIDEQDKKEKHFKELVFGLLDISVILLLFLPLFRSVKASNVIESVSLLFLSGVKTYLKILYYIFIVGIPVIGLLTLTLQNFNLRFWTKYKISISFILNIIISLLLIISMQPYAAVFAFVILGIKVLIFKKW